MTYLSYSDLNNLPEISMFAGSEMTLEFEVHDENGADVDINGGAISWILCPYEKPTHISLQKVGAITTTNKFQVILAVTDTYGLTGRYIQQPIVTDFSGKEFRVGQGVITILPRIPGI